MIQFSHYVSDRFVLFSLTQGDTAGDNEEYGDVVVNETEDDETGDDETGNEVTSDEVIEKEDVTESVLGSESTDPIFGPFRKFSRENELSGYQQELKMVQGKKIICSLDLLLAVFKARCHHLGALLYQLFNIILWVLPSSSSRHALQDIHINSVPLIKRMRCMQVICKL